MITEEIRPVRARSRITPALAGMISLLQGAFFVIHQPTTRSNVLAAALATATLIFCFFAAAEKRFQRTAFILYCGQLVVFFHFFQVSEIDAQHRMMLVCLVLVHCAFIFSILLSRAIPQRKATLFCFSVAFAIFIIELFLGASHYSPGNRVRVPDWAGKAEPNPVLGVVYRPYSTLKTIYPDNPRHYFEKELSIQNLWWLHTGEGTGAELTFPENSPGVVRVAIQSNAGKAPYDIQANYSKLKVKASNQYRIQFEIRSDQPRNLFLGVSQSHEPWNGLGLYEQLNLTSEWKHFEKDFSPASDDDNARIHFDAGGNSGAFEVRSVSLHDLTNDRPVQPDVASNSYSVTYRFNALGCRGGDYAIPKPAKTTRILVLGDSYAMGVGVHEQDTLEMRLQNLLRQTNAAKDQTYEVVNCGVSGYGTREERLFYEEIGKKYQPDLVLLMTVRNDDMSFLEEVARKYVNRPIGKVESVFFTMGKIQDYRYQHPYPNFAKCVDEILQLDQDVRAAHAQLAVIIFRNDPDFAAVTPVGKMWNDLTRTVTLGLKDSHIPVMDVGKALYANHSEDQLKVHVDLDGHPNEIAHRIAANEVFDFIRREKLLKD